jgi:hypothetical protein
VNRFTLCVPGQPQRESALFLRELAGELDLTDVGDDLYSLADLFDGIGGGQDTDGPYQFGGLLEARAVCPTTRRGSAGWVTAGRVLSGGAGQGN